MKLTTKEKARDKRLRKLYGISLDTYKRWAKQQDNKCWICKRSPKKLPLNVDHNHKSEKVRRLLCVTCNRKIVGLIERYKIPVRRLLNYFETFDPDNICLREK